MWVRHIEKEFVLLSRIGRETDSRWGKNSWVHVNLVCDIDIIGGCCGIGTTRDWRRKIVIHMIIGPTETVGFKGSLRFDIWIKIQGCERM